MDDDEAHQLPTECGLDEQGCSVWTEILEAETDARNQPKTAAYRNKLIGIRVLGFFLLDLYEHAHDGYLGTAPYTRVILEAKSCLENKEAEDKYRDLQTLGLSYRNNLIRVFRSNSGSQPGSSAHVSRPSFDRVSARILKELGEVSQTRSSARAQALLRDGYKCTLSGFYDSNSLDKFPELVQAQEAQGQEKATYTQLAHIFSESGQDGDPNYAATVLAMLEMFGLGLRAQTLYGAKINDLHNVITMSMDFHYAFDNLKLWLEPVPGMVNTYDIRGRNLQRLITPFKSQRVTFAVEPSALAAAAREGKTLQLPDPVLLAIRAACSRVANMSGAAEHIDQILRDLEEITTLADDGSMADLLSLRISTAIPSAVQVGG